MPNPKPIRHSKWLQVRAEPELLELLDELAEAERPRLSRSDMVRKLIYEAAERRRKAAVRK